MLDTECGGTPSPEDPDPAMASLSGSNSQIEKPFLPHWANLIKYPQVAEDPVASLPEQMGTVLVKQDAAVELQCALPRLSGRRSRSSLHWHEVGNSVRSQLRPRALLISLIFIMIQWEGMGIWQSHRM